MTGQPIYDAVIIGGGITGLSAAHTLAQAKPSLNIAVVEAEEKLGGKIITDLVDGFVIEGGPDSFVSYKPGALELCRELGLESRLMGTNREQRTSYILYRGRLIELPEGLTLLAPTRLIPFMRSPLFSIMGKLRVGLDLVIPRRNASNDESLADFVRRRMGQQMIDRLAGPLLAGIYAGDPERMSLRATFPQFAELEEKHGSLIRGLLARRREMRRGSQPESAHTMFMTLQGGLRELVEALVKKLEGRAQLLTAHRVMGLTPQEKQSGYELSFENGQVLSAKAVILATPAFVTARFVAGMDPELAKQLLGIRYVSTATVSIAFQRKGFPHPLNGFGYVVALEQARQIMACTWTSTKFPHRAPHDHVLLRCFVGGAGQEETVEIPDAGLVRLVLDNLRSSLGIHQEPVLTKVFRWQKANPQYDVGHLDRVDAIEGRISKFPRLFVAGAAYRGVGLPECIRSGKGAAQAALSCLKI